VQLVAELSVNGGASHDMQHSGPERVLRRDRAGGVIHEYRLMAQVSAPAHRPPRGDQPDRRGGHRHDGQL